MAFIDWLIDTFVPYFGGTKITKTEVFPLDSHMRQISISAHNGSIRWLPLEAGAEPRLILEKEAAGSSAEVMEEYLNNVTIERRTSGTRTLFSAAKPPRPSGVRLVTARFILHASPEQIEDFQAQTSNGRIVISAEFNCNLDLRSRNGRIEVHSGQGELRLSNSNGRIELGRVKLTGASNLTTSNGRITGEINFAEQGSHAFQTSNGSVSLRIPADTRGSFDLATSNGKIDFCLGEETITGRRTVAFTNGPGLSIRVRTSNGSISLTDGTT